MVIYPFASLAQIQILLVPVPSISSSSFESYSSLIRSFDSVRLEDVPVDHKDKRARFMPNPLSTGHLHLSFPSHPPPRSHLSLSLICPSHYPLAVIGVADCFAGDSALAVYSRFESSLIDVLPPDGLYPFSKKCFAFQDRDDLSINRDKKVPGLDIIPNMMGNKKLYIGTLLAELCSQILGELGVVVEALESPLGNEYLNFKIFSVIHPFDGYPLSSHGTKTESLSSLPFQGSTMDSGTANFLSSATRTSSFGQNFRQNSSFNEKLGRKRFSTSGGMASHARLYKILGDFFLLSGRTRDASLWYTEALILLKPSQDFVWHAATLEGLATSLMIDAWSAGSGLHDSTGSKESWNVIDEKLTHATVLYSKAPISDAEPNYSLLTYLYTRSVLRHAFFLFAIWSAKGWGPLAFTTMLQLGSKPYLPPTLTRRHDNDWNYLERLSSISGISRPFIANILSQAHGPWLLHLGVRERITILEASSSIYACLGYRRKEAYILREVLSCSMDLMVCGREEDGLSRMSSSSAIGLGIRDLSNTISTHDLGVRMRESVEGNESVLCLLKYICKVFGVDLEAVKLADRSLKRNSIGSEEYDRTFVADAGEPYGWPELQVGVVREAVAVAEALPDFIAVSQFAFSALKSLLPVLSSGDQYHLHSTASRALATAKRRGGKYSIQSWSGRPVLGISLAPNSFSLTPIEEPLSIPRTALSESEPALATDKLFLYNPRTTALSHEKILIVEKEEISFSVTLQNPFIFELVLDEVSLSTSGVVFESAPLHVDIPPNSIQEIVLSGRAAETGILTIKGCIVQASGEAPRELILPLTTIEEEERLAQKRSSLICEMGRSKHLGLEPFFLKRESETKYVNASPRGQFRLWECKVIPEQPLLRIRRSSITRNALMLYSGEKSTIRITLENVSPLTVDFLELAFEDSTMLTAHKIFTDGVPSVFDSYEIEYDMIHRPAFSWNKENESEIPAGETLTVSVTCMGKVGCTNGSIFFTYSNIGQEVSNQSLPDVLYTRQLSYPLLITVYDILECHGMDVLPFSLRSCSAANGNDGIILDQKSQVNNYESWCLFSIEVRNNYGSSFDVILENREEETVLETVMAVIPQGSVSRIILPIRRFTLSEKEIAQPIPTLSNSQTIVEKSASQMREQRELFWYRERLLQTVHGHWRETEGTRFGELSLRCEQLSLPTLQNLQMQKARVSMNLIPHHSTSRNSVAFLDGKFCVLANQFICLKTQVTNNSLLPSSFVINLEIDPPENVVHESAMVDLALMEIQSGETLELETNICFLTYGKFEFTAYVKAVDFSGVMIRAGITSLCVIVHEGMN